jgi:hypothetical protein
MLRLQAVLEEEVSGRLTRINYGIGDEKWIATRLLGVVMRAQELDVQLLDRADQLVPAHDWHDPAFTTS